MILESLKYRALPAIKLITSVHDLFIANGEGTWKTIKAMPQDTATFRAPKIHRQRVFEGQRVAYLAARTKVAPSPRAHAMQDSQLPVILKYVYTEKEINETT